MLGLIRILIPFMLIDLTPVLGLSSVKDNDFEYNNIELGKQVPLNCSTNDTLSCLKSEISKVMARLEIKTPLEIVPGLSLSWDLPDGDKSFNFENLLKSVNTYLNSISLKIQLLDETILSKGARSLSHILDLDDSVKGRKRKDNSGLIGLAMAMKASMLSMVLAAVGAMSGKAVMVSMMALAFAALSALKGGSEKSSTYEIKHESGHHGHYKRSLNEAHSHNQMAFKGYNIP